MNDVESSARVGSKISLRERFAHFTWAWYTMPMASGGLALLLSVTPHRFDGLETIGKVVFLFDVVCFAFITASITTRFILCPNALPASLRHPTESLFFPIAWLSISNIINCCQRYGVPSTGPWLIDALRVLFWLYAACTFLVAVIQYWSLFKNPPERVAINSMTPAWILPVFPVMLSGTIAGTISETQPAVQRISILIGGVTCQGLGWVMAMLIYTAYIYRLLCFGLPKPSMRPGMFIAVGPPSFTGLALIGMSFNVPEGYGFFAEEPVAGKILQVLAIFIAIFLWLIAAWFFFVTLISVLAGVREMGFHLIWYGFVFPNVGFTISTTSIGKAFKSEGILWVASIMTILLVAVWLLILGFHIYAILTKQIMMPDMDEDTDERELSPEYNKEHLR